MSTTSDILRSFRSLWSLGIAAATGGPLALWAGKSIVPPWPPGAATIATVLAASAAVAVAVLLNGKKQRARKSGAIFTVAGVLLLVVYLGSWSSFIVEQHPYRWVKGWERKPTVDQTAPDESVLAQEGFRPENVWTPGSLTGARLLVLLSFALGFAALSGGMTAFACAQTSSRKR